MEYLTNSFYGNKVNKSAYIEPYYSDEDVKNCVKKLNKWLANYDQQDVKVDAFKIDTELVDIAQYTTVLTIVYHHDN